jgi:hypothetical protein
VDNPYPPPSPKVPEPQTLLDKVIGNIGLAIGYAYQGFLWGAFALFALWFVVALFEPSARDLSPWDWFTGE